ncbi:MAG: cytochrome c oxidase subunit II [Rubrivivax sp.]|nr:cytochrome c oxidase subunit II [Rubrivivax sp.]
MAASDAFDALDALLGAAAPAGPAARHLADWTLALGTGAAAIFAIAMAALWLALRRAGAAAAARARSGERAEDAEDAAASLSAAAQRSARRWIVAGGLVLPLVVLVPLFFASVAGTARLQAPPPPGALQIGITARMWWWEVRYADPEGGGAIVTANEVHIPAGRPVRLGLVSADVIHSFWVAALGGKRDAVPGRVTHLVIEADQPGTWRGQCAEYCGDQHARMAITVVAHEPAAFERWLAAQRAPAAADAAPGSAAARGRAAFLASGCVACHRIGGVGGGGTPTRGPDLTHVAGRRTLGAGQRSNSEAALREWIAGVQHIKPGARMPSFAHLDAGTLDALAAYLWTLR